MCGEALYRMVSFFSAPPSSLHDDNIVYNGFAIPVTHCTLVDIIVGFLYIEVLWLIVCADAACKCTSIMLVIRSVHGMHALDESLKRMSNKKRYSETIHAKKDLIIFILYRIY